ncbi:MAG: PhzF family phenazine biosynthesis protein [Pseudomonadota bacterium]
MKPVLWVDAFSTMRYGGNPCAVVFDADDLSVEDRIAFTRETGLVECAFVVTSDKADFGARYYMPTGEILMAGHPTVATVTAMIDRDLVAVPSSFTLEVGAGVIGIDVTPNDGRPVITMTQLRPEFGREYDPGDIAALYGLTAADIIGAPQTVTTGSPFCITRIATMEAMRAARLDADALVALKVDLDADFMEPFLCITEGVAEGDTFARLLLPPPFPPEDPFTGSATGCMAAWLFAKGAVGRTFIAEQGHGIGRPGRAAVEVLGNPEDITGVKVGGSGVIVMRGTADI